jgi:hypothetical protein
VGLIAARGTDGAIQNHDSFGRPLEIMDTSSQHPIDQQTSAITPSGCIVKPIISDVLLRLLRKLTAEFQLRSGGPAQD